MQKIKLKQQEITAISGKLAREKQFNHKVEINQQLRVAQQALTQLQGNRTIKSNAQGIA